MPRIRFLLDENVSNSVIEVLEAQGHEVIRAKDPTAAGTPDAVLAVLIAHESMVIITHDRDFRSIGKLLPEKDRRRYARGAGRLQLEIPETDARTYIEEHLPLIEFHYADCLRKNQPFQATIQKSGIKFQRKPGEQLKSAFLLRIEGRARARSCVTLRSRNRPSSILPILRYESTLRVPAHSAPEAR